jgi:hypothetical protein
MQHHDRTSKFAVTQLVDKADRRTAWEFLEHLLHAMPYQNHTILTEFGGSEIDPVNRFSGQRHPVRRAAAQPQYGLVPADAFRHDLRGEVSDYRTGPALLAMPAGKPPLGLADKGYEGDKVRQSLLIKVSCVNRRGIRPLFLG